MITLYSDAGADASGKNVLSTGLKTVSESLKVERKILLEGGGVGVLTEPKLQEMCERMVKFQTHCK